MPAIRLTHADRPVAQGMDGSEKGKHYDLPQMEYYKVEAVGFCLQRLLCSSLRASTAVPADAKAQQFALSQLQ